MSDKKVVWVVDFNHLVHKFSNAMRGVSLSTEVGIPKVDSLTGATVIEKVEIDTGVISSLLKYMISKISEYGYNHVVVCADSKNKTRKAYFKSCIADGSIYSSKGSYKEPRVALRRDWLMNGNAVLTLLQKAGMAVLRKENYEADDLVAEAVRYSKEKYPDLPICILANDLDLAPLIDERVSLYKYPAKLTSSEDGFPSIKGYVQITPRNYQSVLEDTVIVKSLGVGAKYNTLLLSKIIRGDSSDNIDCMQSFHRKPKRLREMIENMSKYEPDFEGIFRYYPCKISLQFGSEVYTDIPSDVSVDSILGYLVGKGLAGSLDLRYDTLSRCKLLVEQPTTELNRMCSVLSKYGMDDKDVEEFVARYKGMNLNGAFTEMSDAKLRRRPYRIVDGTSFANFDYQLAKLEALKLQIHI